MATTEAVTQMNETSSSPVEIRGYTFRDVTIKAALTIPDDNDGIETLFSLRPSVHIDWWAFQVSSWSQDGYWRSHMTGIIDINVKAPGHDAAPHGQGVEPGVEGRRIRLRTVFLGYAGHSHRRQAFPAVASSVVKKTSDLIEGKSRYVLHPSTIDSCLQLTIVSIYAGKMEDMTCGSVPVQVDEVSLWPPTKAQLENPKANAYPWTEERGVRLTINETQLVGSDGQLLLSLEASPVKSVGLADPVALADWENPGGRVLEFGALNQATELINYTSTATARSTGAESRPIRPHHSRHSDRSLKLASLFAPGGRIVSDQSTLSSLGKDFSILNLSNGFAIATAMTEQKTSGINGVHTRSIAIIYQHVVVTCDLEGPLLLELEPSELAGLQNLVSNASSDTWVTAGGLMKGATPEEAMASGVARSVTSEMASLDFTTLDLGLGSTTTDYVIDEIVRALDRQIHHTKSMEPGYYLTDGLVYISRLVPDATLNQEYGPQNSIPKATPFKPSDKLVATAKAG
ncbi:Beta-ketoacyl synthase, partial [Metarhizium hybridum]